MQDLINSQNYERLRLLSHQIRSELSSEMTLQTTELLHEAYLKIAGKQGTGDQIRSPKAYVGSVIRSVVIDFARKRNAQRRAADQVEVLSEVKHLVVEDFDIDWVLSINKALEELEQHDELSVRIVECLYFSGLTQAETGELLGISRSAVSKRWNLAKRWIGSFFGDHDAI